MARIEYKKIFTCNSKFCQNLYSIYESLGFKQ